MNGVPKSTDPTSKVVSQHKAPSGIKNVSKNPAVQGNTQRLSSSANPNRDGFLIILKDFFKPIITTLGIAFGFGILDNTPYEDLLNKLNSDSVQTSEKRARYLFDKSSDLLKIAKQNLSGNREEWEDISKTSGVPMSSSQQFLAGGTEAQSLMQHYYNNCAVLCITEAIKNGTEIWSFTDIDNTRDPKTLDPEDTNRILADEHSFWSNESLRLAPLLKIKETGLTARAPFDTLNGVIPEALDESLTYALLNGGVSALFGLGEDNQLIGLERNGLSTLTGSVHHEPGKPLKFSSKVMRLAYFYEFLESPVGPRFDGKSFLESLTEIVRKQGCCYYEPKGLPRYLIDTYRGTGSRLGGEVYLPHYKKIIKLKKEFVDKPLRNLGYVNKEKQKEEEIKAWSNFAHAVKVDVEMGIKHWQRLDAIKEALMKREEVNKIISDVNLNELFSVELKSKTLSDLKTELEQDLENKIAINMIDDSKLMKKARECAQRYIRLSGADKEVSKDAPGCVNYFELIKENSPNYNPQAFFEKVTEGILIAPVVHFVNRHGTPLHEVPLEVIKLLEKVSNNPDVRRYVAKLNHRAGATVLTHPDIINFRNTGAKILKEKGEAEYLNWRLLQHFTNNYSYEDEKTNYLKKPLLKDIKLSTGENLFVIKDSKLDFSENFKKATIQAYEKGDFKAYRCLVNEVFQAASISLTDEASLLLTFLPTKEDLQYLLKKPEKLPDLNPERNTKPVTSKDELEELRKLDISILDNATFLYPNQMFSVNNKRPFDDRYSYDKVINLILKTDELNPLGQYYLEIQPAFDKGNALPHPVELYQILKHENRKIVCHAAGDSKSDIGMLARALESGGYADVVFNQIRDVDIYREIINQRLDYLKDFPNFVREYRDYSYPCDVDSLYKECCKLFGIYALEKVKEDTGVKYLKVVDFDQNGKPRYETKNNSTVAYTEEEIVKELRDKYQGRIIHNTCPEAYIRRRAEIFGLITGQNIEFNQDDYTVAEGLINKIDSGNLKRSDLTEKQLVLLSRYERIVRERKEGYILPQEVPRYNTRYEWHDPKGQFIVYRSRKANGRLLKVKGAGSQPELFTESEKGLSKLIRYEIKRDKEGRFYLLNNNNESCSYPTHNNLERLNDIVVENKFIAKIPTSQGFLANKSLTKIFGKENLRAFVKNLPVLFHGLLKYSGIIMALGGVIRLISPVFGGLSEGFYRTGYWMSNGLRAVSAFGGALRGELNVHKYHNIAFGELINIVSSFLQNGPKHLGLGLGNFVLFLGRGQQAAQRQQRVNNHTKDVLTAKVKPKKELDPRPYVRKITELATSMLLGVKQKATQEGISGYLGEVGGNVVGGFFSTLQFIKDMFKDPRIIFQYKERRSEKSGSFYKSIPSAGHLLTLVGALSGVGALLAGTFGRVERLGDKDENGFNKWGNIFIAFANAIAAPGIFFNAREIMANTSGLPKLFKGLNGRDIRYNPVAAGLRQVIASIGFLLVPWGGLQNKYVASLFDLFNGIYFLGASEEEIPNTTNLGLNILRKDGLYKDPERNYEVIDFKNAA